MRRRVVAFLLLIAALPVASQQMPELEKGFSADKAYHFDDLDAVNLFNGNLNVSIPLGQRYQVSSFLSYQFALTYAGNSWATDDKEVCIYQNPLTMACENVVFAWTSPSLRTNAGMGWLLTFGRLIAPNDPDATSARQQWVYQAPDGSEHEFFGDIYANAAPHTAAVTYTRGQSYIRRTEERDPATNMLLSHVLEFPDGTTKTFTPDGTLTEIADRGTLTETGDRYRNRITLTSAGGQSRPSNMPACNATGLTKWTITDGSRTHYGYFDTRSTDPGKKQKEPYQTRLCGLDLAGFSGTRAVYQFYYTNRAISRQWTSSASSTPPDADEFGQEIGSSVIVPLLNDITLPDGTKYTAVYDIGRESGIGLTSEQIGAPNEVSKPTYGNPGGFSGHLRRLTVPTLGRYEWDYQMYQFPASFTQPRPETQQPHDGRHGEVAAGVATKKKIGKTTQTWNYQSELLKESTGTMYVTAKTTVTEVGGGTVENYFSACRVNCATPYDEEEYGRPLSRAHPRENGRFGLSSRTRMPDGTYRSVYLGYHRDKGVTGQLTLFEDGKVRRETHDLFDGLGHFGSTVVQVGSYGTDALPLPPASIELERTTTTAYRSDFDQTITDGRFGEYYVLPAPGAPWIFGLYSSITTKEEDKSLPVVTTSSKTEYDFDRDTGLLNWKRTLRNNAAGCKDLLSVFSYLHGNMTREEYYGGDRTEDALPGAPCGGSTTPRYALTHTYQYGVRTSSQYDSVGFKSLDVVPDPSTGLPKVTYDSAGVSTSYSYDVMSRLSEVRPTQTAWTRYEYPAATATSSASVLVRQYRPGAAAVAGTELSEQRHYYDALGRHIQSSRRMPVGWSTTWTAYDILGRPEKASVATATTTGAAALFPAAANATQTTYDVLGRVMTVTRPDGTTNFEYPDSRSVKTTASVATSSGDTAVSSMERKDGFGRLASVTEDHGTARANIVTSYRYDVGDRLRTVTMGGQTRSFTYDGAGLLTAETHPESGETSYLYDARGRAVQQTTPGATLTFTYDKAERLLDVLEGTTILKSLRYDRAGDPDDKSKGKLATATRRNAHTALPNGAVKVTEKYIYKGRHGALSEKITTVTTGPNDTELQSFSEQYQDAYPDDKVVATHSLTYPTCVGCAGLAAPPRTVSSDRKQGLVTSVEGYTFGEITYHPNGLLEQLTHRNLDNSAGPVYKQEADPIGRPKNITVNNSCDDLKGVTVTPLSKTLESGQSVTLTASTSNPAAVTGWQWFERTRTGDVLLSGATSQTLTRSPTVTTRYYVRATNGDCSVLSPVATVTVGGTCEVPALITAPASVFASATAEASVQPVDGATYSWTIIGGQIVGSSTAPTVTFTANCVTAVTLTVTVTKGCSSKDQIAINVLKPSAAVDGSKTIAAGGSAVISATLTGVGPWKFTWSDAPSTWITTSSSSVSRTVYPAATATYSINAIEDANGCSGSPNGSGATITVGTPPSCNVPEYTILGIDSTYAYHASSLVDVAVYPAAPSGSTYEWFATQGDIESTTASGGAYVRLGCSGTVAVRVVIALPCGETREATAEILIRRPSAVIESSYAARTVLPGEEVTLQAKVTGWAPTIRWSDGVQQRVDTGENKTATRTVSPAASTVYHITSVTNAYGCAGTVSGSTVVTVCDPPSATISAPASMTVGDSKSASVAAEAGATYKWTISPNASIVGADNGASVTFTSSSCSGTVSLSVTITRSCGTAATGTATVAVTPPQATVSGSTTIAQGSSAAISIILTGRAPWTITWPATMGAPRTEQATSSPHRRVVGPAGTNMYAPETVTDAGGCSVAIAGSATITVQPPAPVGLTATAMSTTSVSVAWSFYGSADRFRIYRNGVHVGDATAVPFVDATAQPGTAYLYSVVAVKAETASAPSAPDLATTVIFSNDPLHANIDTIAAVHVLQLRTAVNLVRAAAGLPAVSFPPLEAVMKADDVQELREPLTAARTILGLPLVGYGPPLSSGTIIEASHIMDLRRGVK